MPSMGASIATAACTSTRTSPVWIGSGNGSAGGSPGLERTVDEQAPDLLERHPADQVLDVDAAVAERRPFLVGLGDLVSNATTPSSPWCTSVLQTCDSFVLVSARGPTRRARTLGAPGSIVLPY